MAYSTKAKGVALWAFSGVHRGRHLQQHEAPSAAAGSGSIGAVCRVLHVFCITPEKPAEAPALGPRAASFPFKTRPPSHRFHDPMVTQIGLTLHCILIVLSTFGADSHKGQASLNLCVAKDDLLRLAPI